MQDFNLEAVGPIGDCVVLQVAGEVDMSTAPMLREQVGDMADKGIIHVIIDMSGVVFIDSTGLGALVGSLKRLRAHDGSLTLVINTERVLRIFEITGLVNALSYHPSVAAAITAVPHWRETITGESESIDDWCRSNDLT